MVVKEQFDLAPGARKRVPRKQDKVPRDLLYRLTLYIAGETPKSTRALINLKALCEKHLTGQYGIQVVDLLEKPHLARNHQIVAIPTVVKELPLPERRAIGDLSDETRILAGLDLQEV